MKKLLAILLAAAMLLTLCACAKKPEDITIEYDGDEVKSLEFVLGDDDEEDIILEAKLEPDGAEGEIEWESSDKSIVKVKDYEDGTCKLTLKDVGDAKVYATCGELKAKVKIYVTEAEEAAPAPEAEEAVEEAAPAEEVVEEAVPAEENSLGGIIDGQRFELPALGLSVLLPDDWHYLSDSEIASTYGIALNMLSEGEIKDALEGGEGAFVMVAADVSGNSVNINVSGLDSGASFITEDTMAEMTLSIMEESMESAGFTVKSISTISGYYLGSEEHSGIAMELETSGITLYEKLIMIIDDGKYYCITATSVGKDSTDDILGFFY